MHQRMMDLNEREFCNRLKILSKLLKEQTSRKQNLKMIGKHTRKMVRLYAQRTDLCQSFVPSVNTRNIVGRMQGLKVV
jgi:hypothetical protein